MKKYEIYETLTYVYIVEAESEEEAEKLFNNGEIGKGELCDATDLYIYERETN